MYLGIGLDGVTRTPNGGEGLQLIESPNNTIGGDIFDADPVERNVFSGNAGSGIVLNGSGTYNNIISGNIIGMDAGGMDSAHNELHGIRLNNGANHNLIGGADALNRNIISDNLRDGIRIVDSGTDYNSIQSNNIGTDLVNSAAETFGNGWNGIHILQQPSGNLIGSDDDSQGNWFNSI